MEKIKAIREKVDSVLASTPFPTFEELVFNFALWMDGGEIVFCEGKAQQFAKDISIEFVKELIGFISDIRAGSFSTCYHHLRKLIELNASFCFVLKNQDSPSRWIARYQAYSQVWRFQHLLLRPDLQTKCFDFPEMQSQSESWLELYEVAEIHKIENWRGSNNKRPFTLRMLFEEVEKTYREICPNYIGSNKEGIYDNYYNYLCQHVHLSPCKPIGFKKLSFGFPSDKRHLSECLRSASSELVLFLMIGEFFNVISSKNEEINSIYYEFSNLSQKISDYNDQFLHDG